MPRFEPFPGVRYDPAVVDIEDVMAPPYDVIDDDERARLAARSPYNAVRVDLPEGGPDRYQLACRRYQQWLSQGVLRRDPPRFYAYRMRYRHGDGAWRHTTGVVGALHLSDPAEGQIRPHEHTTPKARSDRLEVLRTCQANLSAIWALCPAPGLTALCRLSGPPLVAGTDDLGVVHELWPVTDAATVAAIGEVVGGAPVVIADGHHRYETSLAYCREQHAAGRGPGPWDAVLALVVELVDTELDVRAIHRVLSGLSPDVDVVAALAPWFHAEPVAAAAMAPDRLVAAGGLGLLTARGVWRLRPRADAPGGEPGSLDSRRLDAARAGLPPHEVAYHHDAGAVAKAVAEGRAQAGVLLRPPTVAQIAATAEGGERMPPKTTYFWPKPRTGLVFRGLTP